MKVVSGGLGTLIALALAGLHVPAQPQTALLPADTITVRSDIQEANSETGVIVARGNVQIFYPARDLQATSTQAQYFSRERRLILTGDVYVLQEGNSIRAEIMTYLVDEGRFLATPDDNQQVESIYLVPPPEPAVPASSSSVTPTDSSAAPSLPPFAPPVPLPQAN
ncbi:MAG: LptA/OstA family protein [Cyanobacteria bacterium P01_H01_bin.15]